MENKDVIQEHINQKIIMITLFAFVIGFVYWNFQTTNSNSKANRGIASVEEAQPKNASDGE
jgi:hypothetical protein